MVRDTRTKAKLLFRTPAVKTPTAAANQVTRAFPPRTRLSLRTMVLSKRVDKKSGKEELSERYYISSKKATAEEFNSCIRSHWGIENNLHWCLDVVFHEDMSKKRAGESAQNFSLMAKSALNLIKNHQLNAKDSGGTKISLKRKRLMAAWDNDYLMDILVNAK